MPNLQSKITNHNKVTLEKASHTTDEKKEACNCRKNMQCPLEGHCLAQNVVYQATVETSTNKETYVGLTQNEFKTRYRNHVASFKNNKLRNATELSKHIWSLKDNNLNYNIQWKILARAKPYTNANKRCNLCITEKYFIICTHICTLNTRNELTSTLHHANKYLLKNN